MTVYLPRSAWNARASRGPSRLNAAGLLGIALHYPGMGNRHLLAQADVAHALRGWQDYHMDDRGWSDIAYQAAVDQAGRVWTLRGLTTRSGANGDAYVNAQYGALLLVVGDNETPTAAMIASVREVIRDFRRSYPKAVQIKPHSKVRPTPTSCPGNAVRSLIVLDRFEPGPTPEVSEMNDADRAYVDGRMKAYTRWSWMRHAETELDLARNRKDTPAVTVWSPIATQARADWEAVQ